MRMQRTSPLNLRSEEAGLQPGQGAVGHKKQKTLEVIYTFVVKPGPPVKPCCFTITSSEQLHFQPRNKVRQLGSRTRYVKTLQLKIPGLIC